MQAGKKTSIATDTLATRSASIPENGNTKTHTKHIEIHMSSIY